MEAFDPRTRELCPDDACIGLIGPDGRCKECGTVSPNVVSDRRNQGLKPQEQDDDETWSDDERELCPDDACVGLIGEDGRCKECGRSTKRKSTRRARRDDVEHEDEGWVADAGDEPAGPTGPVDPNDWTQRRLCPDGGCIGIIGTDGRCRECGRPAGSARTAPDNDAESEEE